MGATDVDALSVRSDGIYMHGKRWRVQVYVDTVRESTVKPTKQEASAWAVEREAQLSGKKLPDKTFGDAIDRYQKEVSTENAGAKWEIVRLNSMASDMIADRKMSALKPKDITAWRDRRLKKVSPAKQLGGYRTVRVLPAEYWMRNACEKHKLDAPRRTGIQLGRTAYYDQL
ncbi:hypothetical protein DVJ77_20070 [Dyella tabacisoli]|uniref:Integrase n=2 Tax=Dyella tabacisoli TaxID=2282381 RepID=A0A369UIJ6_9GAMM|nr:hypothetical protein DVJ77_20070 [Dyella tabacisoli]